MIDTGGSVGPCPASGISRYRVDGVVLRNAIDRGVSEDGPLRKRLDDSLSSSWKSGLAERQNVLVENGVDDVRKSDERFSKGSPALDVAEILRRWTHALQKVHKQALRLVGYYVVASASALKFIRFFLI